ncbi:hypothetical protein BT96DRAFT_81058 [Gymnopus androsaceus JB14]|uniref:Uncharacterized protein n=1 Tax=Gymnopus androsaceus JB14 TaxID=1447944 RepID=A0A6A4IEZ1_9AGAR|nr:hypothetical protein BT96DRAFT_81058 [Gymnopus androsaceus JB14]
MFPIDAYIDGYIMDILCNVVSKERFNSNNVERGAACFFRPTRTLMKLFFMIYVTLIKCNVSAYSWPRKKMVHLF